MADFSALKAAIQAAIRQNGNNEITGNIMQGILLSIVNTLGDAAINALVDAVAALSARVADGYMYGGIATPTSAPTASSGKVFYVALQAGTYTNYGALVIEQGITILKTDNYQWTKDVVWLIDDVPTAGSDKLVKSGGVYANVKLLKQPFYTAVKQIDSYVAQASFHFVQGKGYKVIVNFSSEVNIAQCGTFDGSDYVDRTEIFHQVQSIEWEFQASATVDYLFVYSSPNTQYNATIYEFDSDKYNRAISNSCWRGIKNINSCLANYADNLSPIQKIQLFVDDTIVNHDFNLQVCGFWNGRVQFHIKDVAPGYGFLVSVYEGETSQPTGIKEYRVETTFYNIKSYLHLIFNWDIYSTLLVSNSDTGILVDAKAINSSEFAVLFENVKEDIETLQKDVETLRQPCVELYSFHGVKDSNVEAVNWTQGVNHISITSPQPTFENAAVFTKYCCNSYRRIVFDLSLGVNATGIFFTQNAGIESMYKQGWCVTVNRNTKKLSIHKGYGNTGFGVSETLPDVYSEISFADDIAGDRDLRLIFKRRLRNLYVELYDRNTLTLLAQANTTYENLIVPSYGLGFDYPAVSVMNGTIKLYNLSVVSPNSFNCNLYIVGDSITDGVPVPQDLSWAYKIAEKVPYTVVSGRGGGTIYGVIKRLQDEGQKLRPKYVMVHIGTNGGVSAESLASLKAEIVSIGAIPIICCICCCPDNIGDTIQSAVNNQVLSLTDNKCVRFDIATAIDNDLSNGADSSLFVSDGVHPNIDGHSAMAKRVEIDLPELFN